MDRIIALLSVFVFLPTCTGISVNPGLKIRITQKGLSYAATQAINSLHVRGLKIPDTSGTADVKVGKVDYSITGMSVKSFPTPQSDLSIRSGQGVHWSITRCSAQLAGDWSYHYKMGFIQWHDHGTFYMSLLNADITLDFYFGVDSQGRPTIGTNGCSADIQEVHVSLHGGASWLYNIFKGQISRFIKGQMTSVLCDQAKRAINVDANKALQRVQVKLPIQKTGVLDYSMLVAPVFATGYVDSYHKGEIYYYGDHEEAPYKPAPFPVSFNTSRMAYVWVSDYLLNTAGYALQKQHVLQYFFSPNDLSPDQRVMMNTTCPITPTCPNCACIGNFISQLQDQFPGCTVSIKMSTSKAPTLEVVPNDILGHFEGDFVFYVNFPNKTTMYIFTSHVLANVSLSLAVSNQKITAKVTQISPNFTVTDSKIGKISGAALTWQFDKVLNPKFIIPQFNKIGAQGLDIPGTQQITYDNPTLNLVQNAVVLGMDLKWTPDFKLERHGKIPYFKLERQGEPFQNNALYFQQGKVKKTTGQFHEAIYKKM